MDSVVDLLKLLFGQVGALGTICVAAAVYSGWLHWNEKEDHKKTRDTMAKEAESRLNLYKDNIATLSEMKSLLQMLVSKG